MPFQVIFMDAGQGDATLIVYPDDSLMLVDCGSAKNKQIVTGEIKTVLDRFLPDAMGKLKALVLTHPDADHYNLVEELIIGQGIQVDTLVYGSKSEFYSGISDWMRMQNRIPLSDKFSSDIIWPALSYKGKKNVPDVKVRILAANAGDPKVKSDANPNSVVLLITYLNINIFLMGDATYMTENFILSGLGSELEDLLNGKRTVLKAGHHGSNSSSTKNWIQKLGPEVVFISSDTRTFNGVSIPRSGVINNIIKYGNIFDLRQAKHPSHFYVQYNDSTDSHEQVKTNLAILTTLHLLKLAKNDNTTFTAYGTSWYYRIDDNGDVYINPAIGWDYIK